MERPRGTNAAVYCEENKSLYLGEDRVVRIDTETGKEIWEATSYDKQERYGVTPGGVLQLVVSPASGLMANVGLPGDWEIHISDMQTGKEIMQLHQPIPYPHLRFSPDGKSLYVFGNARVDRWDLESGKVASSATLEEALVGGGEEVSLSEDFQIAMARASVPGRRAFVICSATTGKLLHRLESPLMDQKFCLLRDGQQAVTAAGYINEDGSNPFSSGATVWPAKEFVRIWDIGTGKQTMALAGDTTAVSKILAMPASSPFQLMTASYGGDAIFLWDIHDGRCVGTYRPSRVGNHAIMSATPSDGGHFVTVSVADPKASRETPSTVIVLEPSRR